MTVAVSDFRGQEATAMAEFRLDDDFIAKFANQQPEWGPVGRVTYLRTYARSFESVPARVRELGLRFGLTDKEDFWLTIVRAVEGCYEIQRKHCDALKLPWDTKKAQQSAQEMYQLIFDFKFLPPGRGLWLMGTEVVDKIGGAGLSNCGMCSTAEIDVDFAGPFCFMADMSMLGVGVSGDMLGAGKITIQQPQLGPKHVVADTREGWVDLIRRVLESYVGKETMPTEIDYSQVRAAGSLIKTFGGVSAGPGPLMRCIRDFTKILDPLVGRQITSTAIVDLFNVVGVCVVSGNVRRSAQLMLGSASDTDFMNLKNPMINKDALESHRWASNNSVIVDDALDYRTVAAATVKNGEPGYVWLQNMRDYGRMSDPPDYRDARVCGTNPCSEMSLEPFELCNIAESFPSRHETLEEFLRTLKYGYLWTKTVSLVPTHDRRTNAVMLRNRRIGVSMSGIVQAMQRHGRREFFRWCDMGYAFLKKTDKIYSQWLCVPESVKLTTTKPSGSVSLLPGVTAGIHYPHAEYYYRVIRFAADSAMLPALRAAGYRCVDLAPNEPNTTAVYFPVREQFFDRAKRDVTLWEQMENVAQVQAWWSDNSVSATVHFQPHEAKDIAGALELYSTRLKSISFLPLKDHGYSHAPYQEITREEYEAYAATLKPLDFNTATHEVTERFCDGDKCTV